MPRVFKHLEAGCLQVNLMSTSAQINQQQIYYTILLTGSVISHPPAAKQSIWQIMYDG